MEIAWLSTLRLAAMDLTSLDKSAWQGFRMMGCHVSTWRAWFGWVLRTMSDCNGRFAPASSSNPFPGCEAHMPSSWGFEWRLSSNLDDFNGQKYGAFTF